MHWKDLKVYVGCSLTYASKEFIKEVEDFKKALEKAGVHVLHFISLHEGNPKKIYDWDIKGCVAESHMMVAVMDLPSTGLGYEISTHLLALKKPVMGIAKHDSRVTDMLLDPDEPGYDLTRYNHLHAAIPVVVKRLKILAKSKNLKKKSPAQKRKSSSVVRKAKR